MRHENSFQLRKNRASCILKSIKINFSEITFKNNSIAACIQIFGGENRKKHSIDYKLIK